MKVNLSAGLAAGLIALSAAPAVAAPTVSVRVEGASRTLVDTVRVTTSAQPFAKAGHDCSGTSVGGALERATAGAWTAGWDDTYGQFVQGIAGETPAGDDYWSLWVNHRPATVGACAAELQEGDGVLFFVDTCHFDGAGCSNAPVLPLGLSAPGTVTAGSAATVSVVRYDAGGLATPVAGARVSGGGAEAITDQAGNAVLTFSQLGTVRLRAEKPGSARSEGVDVVVGAPKSPAAVLPSLDRTPPTARLSGLTDRQVLSRGPRVLRGSFGADPSGIRAVKLRLTRRIGARCWYFSGRSERFRGARCGHGPYFAIGDRADWSYLLPARLGPGRYVLDAVAIDGAGNRTPLARGTTRVVFTVR